MLRFVTAGESHGQELVAWLSGIPADLRLQKQDKRDAARRSTDQMATMGPHPIRSSITTFARNVSIGMLAAGAMAAFGPYAFAQHPEVDALAAQVAQDLVHHHANVVTVSYFKGPKGGVTEAGRILSLEFSSALNKAAPQIQIITPEQMKALAGERYFLPSDVFEPEAARQLSGALGAKAQVRGTLKRDDQTVRLDLEWVDDGQTHDGKGSSCSPKKLGEASASLPVSAELARQFTEPNSENHNGFLFLGVAGATDPSCIHCPVPHFTPEARRKRIEGTVNILMTIKPEGTIENPILLCGPAADLEEVALKAVQNWRFNPAKDPNGKPGALRLMVEVVFRLLI